MSISEQIETIITSMTDNNYPPQLVTITKTYNERICDITTNTGEVMKRVRCSNLAVEDTIALLTYPDGDPNKPFVLLFTDELNPCNFEVLNEELVIDFCGEARKGGNTPSTGVDIVTSWSVSPADDRVPSEKLTKNSLDDKSDVGHSHTMGMITGLETALNGKQDTLVSGTTIKTINNNSLLGSGNITIEGGGTGVDIVTSWNSTPTDTSVPSEKLTKDTLDLKLDSSDAFSGDYDDLTNKPTIPSKTSDLTNDGDGTNVFVKNNDSRLSDARTPTTHTHTKSEITDFPTIPSKTSDLTNDSGFITSSSLPTKTSDLTNDGDGTNPFLTQHQSLANYVQKSATTGLLKNDGTVDTTQYLSSLPAHNHDGRYYTESEVDTALGGKQATLVSGTNIKTINNQSLLGSGNITIQGGGTVTVDDSLSTTSTNPVQNKVITTALNGKAESSSLSTVATTGSYNDLSNKPTIPSKITDLTNDSDFIETSSTTGLIKNDGTIDTTNYYSSISVTTGVDTSNEVLYIDITLN